MKDRVIDFIRNGGDFESLAIALHRWQRSNNPEYDRFCGSAEAEHWSQIPAVPTALFQDVSLTCFPPSSATVTFRTSGTTGGTRGCIRLRDVEVYELAARMHAQTCLGTIPGRGVSFVPMAPDSSLGHMCASFVPDMQNWFDAASGVNTRDGWASLRSAASTPGAMFVPGTAFALADLLDLDHEPLALPAGSVVMVTGGFKGRRRVVPPAVLHARLQRQFPGAQVVGEYGMSELASQLWAVPVGAAFVPPPWMRVMAVDPWTGEPATRGVLRFFDLANHQTVLAIETADVGIVRPDGCVLLEGRLEGSAPRGCSLTVEEANA